jgi:hypothetical protein
LLIAVKFVRRELIATHPVSPALELQQQIVSHAWKDSLGMLASVFLAICHVEVVMALTITIAQLANHCRFCQKFLPPVEIGYANLAILAAELAVMDL